MEESFMFDVFFWKYLPKKKISHWMGKFAKQRWSRYLIPIYIKIFHVDIQFVKKPLHQFNNLLEFFTRELLPEARPVDFSEQVIISPVDGTISQMGTIEQGRLLQGKGVLYSLERLLGNQKKYIDKFMGGQFVTIYLSPRDYHRIHTPLGSEVVESTYIPGKLYPVNRFGVRKVPGLFAINERMISYLHTACGYVALIKVGATNVGSIKVVFDEEIATNPRRPKPITHKVYSYVHLDKGDEIGWFEFGSTVLLLFESNRIEWMVGVKPDTTVRMGEGLARIIEEEKSQVPGDDTCLIK
jgi:phosphatidylserine decarboxylase